MMFTNRVRVLFTLAVAIAGVSAQSFDQCGQRCINTTLAEGICTSLNDTNCICTNTTFQSDFSTCLKNCSSADLTAAEAFEKETCSNVSSSNTSSSSSSSSSATSSSAAPSTKSTSASSGASAVEQLPLLSAAIVVIGVMMGGAFAL